jgi:hypothetical protein
MKATGWLPHSVRGFLSGTARKKMGLTVTSTKSEDGEHLFGRGLRPRKSPQRRSARGIAAGETW